MMEVMKKLEAVLTGRNVPLRPSADAVTSFEGIDLTLERSVNHTHEYEFRLRLGAKIAVRPGDLEPAKRNVLHMFNDSLYGELNSDLDYIMHLAYNTHDPELIRAVSSLMTKVREVE